MSNNDWLFGVINMRRVLPFIAGGILLVCVFHTSYAICDTGNFASLMINPQDIENCALLNITWEKHLIDDDFDYAFGVHVADVDGDGDCDVLGAAN